MSYIAPDVRFELGFTYVYTDAHAHSIEIPEATKKKILKKKKNI